TDFDEPEETTTDFDEPEETTTDFDEPEETTTDFDEPEETTTDFDEPEETTTVFDESEETSTDFDEPEETTTDFDEPEETTTDFDEPEETTTDFDEPEETSTDLDEPEETTTGLDELEETSTDFDEPEETSTDFDEPEETTTDFDEPEETTTDFDEPEETSTDLDEPEETTTGLDELEETSTDFDEPEETSTDFDEPEETTTDFDEPEETTTDFDEPEETTTVFDEPEEIASEADDSESKTKHVDDSEETTTDVDCTEEKTSIFDDPEETNSSIYMTTSPIDETVEMNTKIDEPEATSTGTDEGVETTLDCYEPEEFTNGAYKFTNFYSISAHLPSATSQKIISQNIYTNYLTKVYCNINEPTSECESSLENEHTLSDYEETVSEESKTLANNNNCRTVVITSIYTVEPSISNEIPVTKDENETIITNTEIPLETASNTETTREKISNTEITEALTYETDKINNLYSISAHLPFATSQKIISQNIYTNYLTKVYCNINEPTSECESSLENEHTLSDYEETVSEESKTLANNNNCRTVVITSIYTVEPSISNEIPVTKDENETIITNTKVSELKVHSLKAASTKSQKTSNNIYTSKITSTFCFGYLHQSKYKNNQATHNLIADPLKKICKTVTITKNYTQHPTYLQEYLEKNYDSETDCDDDDENIDGNVDPKKEYRYHGVVDYFINTVDDLDEPGSQDDECLDNLNDEILSSNEVRYISKNVKNQPNKTIKPIFAPTNDSSQKDHTPSKNKSIISNSKNKKLCEIIFVDGLESLKCKPSKFNIETISNFRQSFKSKIHENDPASEKSRVNLQPTNTGSLINAPGVLYPTTKSDDLLQRICLFKKHSCFLPFSYTDIILDHSDDYLKSHDLECFNMHEIPENRKFLLCNKDETSEYKRSRLSRSIAQTNSILFKSKNAINEYKINENISQLGNDCSTRTDMEEYLNKKDKKIFCINPLKQSEVTECDYLRCNKIPSENEKCSKAHNMNHQEEISNSLITKDCLYRERTNCDSNHATPKCSDSFKNDMNCGKNFRMHENLINKNCRNLIGKFSLKAESYLNEKSFTCIENEFGIICLPGKAKAIQRSKDEISSANLLPKY
ncbi:hypothetical protein AYI70_g8466, partial [Smittium culicis]